MEGRHLGHYIICNVSGRPYNTPKFNARIIDGNWHGKRAPSLGALYNYSYAIFDYLSKDPKNVVVVHCTVSEFCFFILFVINYQIWIIMYRKTIILNDNSKNYLQDGRASTAMLISSFLIMMHVFGSPEQVLNMFAIKRTPPGLQPSQFRWVWWVLKKIILFTVDCVWIRKSW